jgi:hypothetical protein
VFICDTDCNALEAQVLAGKLVDVVLENYAAHEPEGIAWLGRHPRFVYHLLLLAQRGRDLSLRRSPSGA